MNCHMDIDYLLFLQNLREHLDGMLDGFFMVFTQSVDYVFFVIAIIYWGISKRLGETMFLSYGFNRIGNAFLKQTFCAYRPWVRSSAIHPIPEAQLHATGYSFPSGHTTNAMVMYGTPMLHKGMSPAFRVLMAILILLVAFSRNFVGVHTPQDVVVAILVGLLLIWAAMRTVDWVDGRRGREWVVAAVGVAVCALLVVYILFKSYPMDYDSNGNLLVDPERMSRDAYRFLFSTVAILVCWAAERTWIGFRDQGSVCERITRTMWGVFGLIAVNRIVVPCITAHVDGFYASTFLTRSIPVVYMIIVVPLCIRLSSRRAG